MSPASSKRWEVWLQKEEERSGIVSESGFGKQSRERKVFNLANRQLKEIPASK